jgi:hypothetical protein
MPLVLPLSEGLGRTRDCRDDLRAGQGNGALRVLSRAGPEVASSLLSRCALHCSTKQILRGAQRAKELTDACREETLARYREAPTW